MRRIGLLTGLMFMALLPAVAAMSPVGAAAPDVAMALRQPIASVPSVTVPSSNALLDSGLIALVGTGLMGLASIVRRTTKN